MINKLKPNFKIATFLFSFSNKLYFNFKAQISFFILVFLLDKLLCKQSDFIVPKKLILYNKLCWLIFEFWIIKRWNKVWSQKKSKIKDWSWQTKWKLRPLTSLPPYFFPNLPNWFSKSNPSLNYLIN